MRSCEDIGSFLQRQPDIMTVLAAVASLGLDDGWVGAGLVRNAVWDVLHDRPVAPHAASDVDVVYCDRSDTSRERDLALEAQLLGKLPAICWSVHNQARMHARNRDAPYRDTEDAVRHWPETATAVAARIVGDRVQVIAPHGVDDLVGLIVRPTPAFARKLPLFRERITAKGWRQLWPKLVFIDV
jgi:hypothetical protein